MFFVIFYILFRIYVQKLYLNDYYITLLLIKTTLKQIITLVLFFYRIIAQIIKIKAKTKYVNIKIELVFILLNLGFLKNNVIIKNIIQYGTANIPTARTTNISKPKLSSVNWKISAKIGKVNCD